MNPAKSFPIKQSYINLAIVTAKEQHEKEKQLHNVHQPDTIMSTFEEIYGMKTAIDINDIFKTCKNKKKQVLVFGRAGIGKSTFCRYVAYQWATGAYWSEYELLILIPLRHLTTDRYPPLPPGKSYSLVDLVKREVLSLNLSEKEDKLLIAQFDAKKTLWILDGYDEIVQNVPAHLKCLFEQLLKTPHHILTSRPYLNTLSYDVQMEITGFTDENIEEYVQQFFNQMKDELDNTIDKNQTLLKYLQSNRSIWGVAHIPVDLELICSVWSNEDSFETKDLTITSLYSTMTEWLCRRYLTSTKKQSRDLSNDEINQYCEKELAFLEGLAFYAMESNTIIIRPSLLKKALDEANVSFQDYPHVLNLGILKSFNKQGIGTKIETNKDHYFIHLSFQEYFTARYLINALKGCSTEKAVEFIKYQKYNQRYTLVFTFMSGLLAESDLESYSNIFWDVILREPLDLVGIRHIELVVFCLEAVANKSILPQHNELLQHIAKCIQYSFDSGNKIIRKHLSHLLQRAPSLTCDHKIINVLINLLQYDDKKTKSEVLVFISELKISNPSIQLIESVVSAVQDKNTDVRVKACFALGSMSEKAATNEAISQLVSTVGDEDDNVRAGAFYALGMISVKTATNEIIDKLVNALEDENENVRASASYVLGKLSMKTVTNEMIDKLMSALGHANKHVRARVRYFFGNMSEKAPMNEVIKKLLSALEGENEHIRAGALYVLGKMGKKAGTNEVISMLLNALTDNNEYVRNNACEALGNMGEKAATDEVISKLMSALGDENGCVRRNACEVLGNMGEKAATNKVIEKLISALESEDENDRRNACEAIGMIGEKAAMNEVMRKLVKALGDANEKVRISACKALGMMCVKAATDEMISSLANALKDPNEEVRVSACESLGMMGRKASTNEVISSLVNALGDKSKNVRASALYVLGKMGEKAAIHEMIGKVVCALRDENINVRSSACYTLGDLGGSVVTNEVINELVSALVDVDENVRAGACKALGKMGEIAATNEVMSTLINALGDVSGYVRNNACEALGNIGVKRATNKIVSDLIFVVNNDHYVVSHKAAETVSNIVTSSFVLKLDSQLISDLCLSKHGSICSKNVSVEQLIDICFTTNKSECLSVVYLFALVQRIAVIVDKNKLVIYGTKEPTEIVMPNLELGQQLIEVSIAEAKRLHLNV